MALWVFCYGSLLWNPGFEVTERQLATLKGYSRSFCMLSIHHRGTEEAPGLVLALDTAERSECKGVAMRAAPGTEEATLADLRERELISSAYYEVSLPIELESGAEIEALCYVIHREHRQYCRYELEEQAQIIAKARGLRGPNPEYLHNTAAHLADLGVEDPDLKWLSTRVRELCG
jgi:cation transport protein ChaC